MSFLQSLEYAHFLLISSRLDLLLTDIVGECTAGHRECNDADDHDDDAEYLLEEGAGRHVAVPDRRDCRDGEVYRGHVDLYSIAVLKTINPRVFGVWVDSCHNNPAAANNVSSHRKIGQKLGEPFVVRADVGNIHHPL